MTMVSSRSAIKNIKEQMRPGQEQSEQTPGGLLHQRNELNINLGSGSRVSDSPQLPMNFAAGQFLFSTGKQSVSIFEKHFVICGELFFHNRGVVSCFLLSSK